MTSTCHGAGGTGTHYSYAELEGLWINAGGSKTYAPLMAAIADAESGGCSTALAVAGLAVALAVNGGRLPVLPRLMVAYARVPDDASALG